jgi:type IV pilus assembly protein PilO
MSKTLALPLKIDPAALRAQFGDLRNRHPGLWPALPRGVLLAGLFAAILGVGHLTYWSALFEELDAGRAKEATLKAQYAEKLTQAISLEALRKQKEQVGRRVSQLEKQLPSKAEMDAVLSDINQAGVGRGAQLVLFKPGETVVKDYYAELPIAVRVIGSYHDLGAFASDLANLPRIVTLQDVQIAPHDRDKTKNGMLVMDATAKTFRYLDADEIAQQRAAQAKKKKAPGSPS